MSNIFENAMVSAHEFKSEGGMQAERNALQSSFRTLAIDSRLEALFVSRCRLRNGYRRHFGSSHGFMLTTPATSAARDCGALMQG